MKKLILILITLFFTILAFGVPSEQDRAILEDGSVNILKNPGFEARLSSWTKTGTSTLTIESTNPGNGKYSGKWNPALSGEFLRSELALHPEKLAGRTCTVRIETKWSGGVDGEIIWYVEDSALNKLTTEKNVIISTDWQPDILVYTCPAVGTTTSIVFESTANAAELSLEDLSLGKSGIVDVSQAVVVLDVNRATSVQSITSVAQTVVIFNTEKIDLDNQYDTATGIFTTKIAGRYEFNKNLTLADFTINERLTGGFLKNGTDLLCFAGYTSGVGNISVVSNGCVIDLVVGDTISAVVDSTSDAAYTVSASTLPSTLSYMSAIRFPSTSAELITVETSGGDFDVTFGNDCSFTRSTGAIGAFNSDATCTFTERKKTGIFKTITHSNSPGDPTPGLKITPNRDGTMYICMETSINGNSLTASSYIRGALIYNDGVGSGDVVIADSVSRMANSTDNVGFGYSLCGLVPLKVGQVMSVDLQGAFTSGTNIISGPSLAGLHSVWKGFVIDHSFPNFVNPDVQNSLNLKPELPSGSPRVRDFYVHLIASTCTVVRGGTGIFSTSSNGTGRCQITLDAGVFTEKPTCSCITRTTTNYNCLYDNLIVQSPTVIAMATWTTVPALVAGDQYIKCKGTY